MFSFSCLNNTLDTYDILSYFLHKLPVWVFQPLYEVRQILFHSKIKNKWGTEKLSDFSVSHFLGSGGARPLTIGLVLCHFFHFSPHVLTEKGLMGN